MLTASQRGDLGFSPAPATCRLASIGRGWAGTNVYGEHYIGHPTLDMSPIAANGTYVLWQNVPYEWALHVDKNAQDHAAS